MANRVMAFVASCITVFVAFVMIVASVCANNVVWLLMSLWYFVSATIVFVVAYLRWHRGKIQKNNGKSDRKGIDKQE